MSIRLTAGNFLYRGGPYASGYPGLATAFPIAALYSAKGLLYRHVEVSGSFECLICYARKNDGGAPYFFTGKEVSGNWRIDAGGSVAQTAIKPPLGEWVQYAIRIDASHATEKATLLWKHIGDAAWANKLTMAGGAFGNPGRFFLGIDEWQVDGGNTNPGNTSLSNTAIWSIAKTDAELLIEANSSTIVNAAGLWAHWPMNDPADLGKDISGNNRILSMGGAPILGAASPLEVPPSEAIAVSSSSWKRWVSSGNAQAEAIAISAAKMPAWRSSANAQAIAQAIASALWKRWMSSGNAQALVIATASAKFKKWRSTGIANVGPIIPPIDTGGGVPPIIDADVFSRIRSRAASVIAKYGATVWFYGSGEAAHENADGSWTEATDSTRFDAKGIQTRGDPDQLGLGLVKVNLILDNPVTVLVAAVIERTPGHFEPIAGDPVPQLHFEWANIEYTIVKVLPVAPSGKPIYFVVVGDA